MRYTRYFFTTLIVLLLLATAGTEVLAMHVGFSTEPLSSEDINTFLQNTNITILTDEPPKKAIECFDVNDNEIIAIGCGAFDQKTVCIYANNGEFQYGYSFKCTGEFGIELSENTVTIYFVRSDVAMAIDPTGKIESVCKIQNTSENNSYWNNSVFLTQRKAGDSEYIIKNNMGIFNIFASSYSQLISTTNGKEIVIYDVSSTQSLKTGAMFFGILIFISIIVFTIIRQVAKH